MIKIEEAQDLEIVVPSPWVRFILRMLKLKTGHRYMIVLDIDRDMGPTWTISSLGQVERGLKIHKNGKVD